MAVAQVANESDLTRFVDNIGKVDFDSFADDAARREALAATKALSRRLETPVDTLWDLSLLNPALYVSLKIALDLDIFNKLDEDGARPKTTQELAGEADLEIVRCALRGLVSQNYLDQSDPDTWVATRLTSALRKPEVNASIDYLHEISNPTMMALPHYLKKEGYKVQTDVAHGNWQYAYGTDMTHFEWMAANPFPQKLLWDLMKGFANQPGNWTDVYPTEALLVDSDPAAPLVVDVGGAEGRDMQSLLEKQPAVAGRVVFQDLEPVIKDAEYQRAAGLTPMVHNFFEEQPVKGARVYFLHRIMHDWPDEKGREILGHIKSAMKKGYSRLLLNDCIIPPTHANSYQTSLDLLMIGIFSSRERTEESWKTFLESAGFRVVKFWQSLAAHEGVVEAEPI